MMTELQTVQVDKTPAEKAKGIGSWLASNLLPILAFLVPAVMIFSAFFDIKLVGGMRIAQNGLFLVAEILIGERVTLLQGSKSGKLDKDLIAAEDKYHAVLEKVTVAGITRLSEFCEAEAKDEFPKAKHDMISACGLTDDQYEEYASMSWLRLAFKFGAARGTEIYHIRKLKPIVLSESMLLCESLGHYRRRQITESGDEIVARSTFSAQSIMTGIFTAVFFAAIMPVVKNGITLADISYVAIVLVCLLWRMALGYFNGYRAQAVGQRKSLETKVVFLNRYLEYLDKPAEEAGKEGE